jgi:hypothetical protein
LQDALDEAEQDWDLVANVGPVRLHNDVTKRWTSRGGVGSSSLSGSLCHTS